MKLFVKILLFVFVALITNVKVTSATITFSNIQNITTSLPFHTEIIAKGVFKISENDLANSCKNEQDLVDYRNWCEVVDADATKGVLKPLGLGSTGRTVAANLTEQLAMKEIMSNPTTGKVLIQNMKDASGRWHGWSKMSNKTAHGVEIHYNALWENGVIKAIDDFKFISP